MDDQISIPNTTNITTAPRTNISLHFQVTDYVLLSCYSAVVIIGVIGNLLVIKWFSKEEKRQKPGSILVIILAVNDLIASIVTPLNEMNLVVSYRSNPSYTWHLGEGLCKTLSAFSNLVLLSTPWLLVAIATERYQ